MFVKASLRQMTRLVDEPREISGARVIAKTKHPCSDSGIFLGEESKDVHRNAKGVQGSWLTKQCLALLHVVLSVMVWSFATLRFVQLWRFAQKRTKENKSEQKRKCKKQPVELRGRMRKEELGFKRREELREKE